MKYNSIYSPGKQCNSLQYICELLCQKKAEHDKVFLPIRFWETMPAWDRFFKKNLRNVARLLKIYDERAIINTIHSPSFKNRYSLFTDYAEKLIVQEQEKIHRAKEVVKTKIVRPDVYQKPRTSSQTGILDKLANLD